VYVQQISGNTVKEERREREGEEREKWEEWQMHGL